MANGTSRKLVFFLIRNTSPKSTGPSTFKSDKHPISPYNISPESIIKVTGIKEMIIN